MLAGAAGHKSVTALAFSSNDELPDKPPRDLLAAGTAQGAIFVFDLDSAKLVDKFAGLLKAGAPVTALALGPVADYNENLNQYIYRHEYIAVAQPYCACVLSWDLRLQQGKRLLAYARTQDTGGGGPLEDVSYNHADHSLWAFDIGAQRACQWNCSSGELVYSEARPAELEPVRVLTRSLGGRYTLLKYPSGGIEVFDSWQATGGVTDYGLPVFQSANCFSWQSDVLAVSSLGFVAAAGGSQGGWAVELVGIPTGGLHIRLSTADKLSALAFSQQGDKLAGGGPGYVIIWDARTGRELHRFRLK